MLGRTIAEDRGLTLSASPWLLAVGRAPGEQSTEYVALINHPLDSGKLMQFLLTLAPSRLFAASRYAVIADWEMPDQDMPSARRLQQRHVEGLGPHWHDFNQHRPSLLHTLLHDPDVIRSVLSRIWTPAWARARLLAHATGAGLGHEWGFFSRNPAGQEMKYALLAAIRARQQARRRGEPAPLSDAEVIRRFGRWRSPRKWRLVEDVFAVLPADLQKQLITAHAELQGRYLVREDAPEGAVVYDQDEVQVRTLGTRWVAVSVGPGLHAEAHLTADLQGYDAWRIMPETIVNQNVLLPLVRWTKDGAGQRTWQFAELGPELAEQWLKLAETLPRNRDEDILRWNPVLGPLVVAYLEPALRQDWPERQGLPGGEFRQPMGPAQVPVLALQHRETLLSSRLITACEQYADQHVR